MDYLLISGVVGDLTTTDGYENLSPIKDLKEGIAVAGIIATVMDSPSSSSILAGSRNSAEIKMKFFTCFVGGKLLRGRFYQVGFCNGEEMEFVVTSAVDGYEVHGARSIARRFIWTLPYQSRGHLAQMQSDLTSSLIWALSAGVAFYLIGYFQSTGIYIGNWEMAMQFSVMGFFIVFLVNIAARCHFYKFSKEATKILKVFGFVDPGKVNLPRSHAEADILYARENNESRSDFVPLRFRYAVNNTRSMASKM